MRRLIKLLLLFTSVSLAIQVEPLTLQQVSVKDKILAGNLYGYMNKTNAQVVLVHLRKRNNIYQYQISGIYFFEQVKDNPTPYWGKWNNKILMFDSGSELDQICTISNKTDFSILIKYIKRLLTSKYRYDKNGKVIAISTVETPKWTFEVENGREIWLYDNEGYDSRDVVEPPNHR